MTQTDIPANTQSGGLFGDLLNRIFSCLRKRTPVAGSGIALNETQQGVVISANIPTGTVIYIKACLGDGTECYVPVRTAGMPFRSIGAADYEAVSITEEDIPDGSIVLE